MKLRIMSGGGPQAPLGSPHFLGVRSKTPYLPDEYAGHRCCWTEIQYTHSDKNCWTCLATWSSGTPVLHHEKGLGHRPEGGSSGKPKLHAPAQRRAASP